MKKAVVTGGSGFIGGHLVDFLVDAGWEVHSLDVKDPVYPNPKAIYAKIDVSTLYASHILILKNADCLFHLAATPRVQECASSPVLTFDNNVFGTYWPVAKAKEMGVKKIVFASSSAVYGQKTSNYGLHKILGEDIIRHSGIPYANLRLFNVYGPRMDADEEYPLVIPKFIKQFKAGEPFTIYGDGSHSRDYVHVYDVCQAFLLAAQLDEVGNANIGTGAITSTNELAEIIGGVGYPRTHLPGLDEPECTRSIGCPFWKSNISIKDGIKSLLDSSIPKA